jgi:glycosyltransferase involved in cell wall biosynthesis
MSKKPLYKRAFKTAKNIITVRPVRKYFSFLLKKKKFKRVAFDIESSFSAPVVYIFQFRFFDRTGENCFNGGAERYLRDLAEVLANSGKTPVLIQLGEKKLWERQADKLKIIGVPVKDVYDYLMFLRLLRNYEFVIYSGYDNLGKKLHPNILISHGINWDGPDNDVRSQKVLKILSDVDAFVSVDTNTISWLRTTFARTLLGRKMNYIPNYVDTDIYKPSEKSGREKINICFPRRLAAERGYWLISSVLPKILVKYPNVIFNFVGFVHGEKIMNDMRSLMDRFPDRVNHSIAEPDEMVSVYQQNDISLIPTLYSEGTSLSCLEAQACGNLVIATNIGGLPNLIIDGYNGFLINPDEDELCLTLERVILNLNLYKKISENAVASAKAFDKKIWESRWENIIRSVGEK